MTGYRAHHAPTYFEEVYRDVDVTGESADRTVCSSVVGQPKCWKMERTKWKLEDSKILLFVMNFAL